MIKLHRAKRVLLFHWRCHPAKPVKSLPRAQGRREAGSVFQAACEDCSVLGALGLPDQVVRIVSIQLPSRLGALYQLSRFAEHC